MSDPVIVEFKRKPSLGNRVDYIAVFSDGQEVPFTIYTDKPKKSNHAAHQYFSGRIKTENQANWWFATMAFDKECLAIRNRGVPLKYDFVAWLLEGEKVKSKESSLKVPL